jgi:hypothetical protein
MRPLQDIYRRELAPIQQTILDCVLDEPGGWTRSGLAKLLVGSKSSRSAGMVDPSRLRPPGGPRPQSCWQPMTFEFVILIQQHLLSLDPQQKLVSALESPSAAEAAEP